MNTVKISKKDALLLTAAGLGMAMSQKAEEGQKIVQAVLKNYVRPMSGWVSYGLMCHLSDALKELACGRIESYLCYLEEAQEKCLEELNKEKKPKFLFQGKEYRMTGGTPEEGCFLWDGEACAGFYFEGVLSDDSPY